MCIRDRYKEQIMVDEIRRIMSEITGRDFSNINENISLFIKSLYGVRGFCVCDISVVQEICTIKKVWKRVKKIYFQH